MGPLIFLLVTIALLAVFFALVSFETTRGVRFFTPFRAMLDEHVLRAEYVATHVDWRTYATEQVRTAALWIGHEIAHESLRFVRFVERLLSRTVRNLRARVATEVPPSETTRPFVQALSDFKEELKLSRPDELDNPPV